MNPSQPNKIRNYAEILKPILDAGNGPISVEKLAEEILQKRASAAKNPHQAALAKIREEVGRQLVYLDKDHILPLRLAFQGARYRIRLNQAIVVHEALPLNRCFEHYLSSQIDWTQMRVIDSQGDLIPFQVLEPPHKISFNPEEKIEYQAPVIVLKDWFHDQKFDVKDQLLVTIEDWERGIVRLTRESFENQRPDLIAARNQLVADQLYAMLETAKYEDIIISVALPTIYASLPDKQGTPPDHWRVIVENDGRMTTDGWSIHYSDDRLSQFDDLLMEEGEGIQPAPESSFSEEDGQKVYRWRAQLVHAPSIWREVEILGRQSIKELDSILRDAFQHDTSDHLSAFWKRVVRAGGVRKRYREVEIADVNPFEPTEEEDTAIAALELKVGDQLKYVYDFGDWVEHTLELKSIGEAEKKVKYPREVARNKPKQRYCVECQKKGKQSMATWICYTCSNEEQEEVFLCDKCSNKHEDHEIEELLY